MTQNAPLSPPLDTPSSTAPADSLQRFFFDDAPVRGDLVQLSAEGLLDEVLSQKDYPAAIKLLLSELLSAAALLVSGIKFEGRLSIQLQGLGALNWAMAECSDTGVMRALAQWDDGFDWSRIVTSSQAIEQLDDPTKTAQQGVIFLNMEPDDGERYQSIVERTSNSLADTLSHYLKQSMQIQSHLQLSAADGKAGALLLQKLPGKAADSEAVDTDLWGRTQVLARTLTSEELLGLPATQVLTRLFHEETVRLAKPHSLRFGCTCSQERMQSALLQLSESELNELFTGHDVTNGQLPVECRFCGKVRRIQRADLLRH